MIHTLEIVESYQGGLRQIISMAVQQGIPIPAFSAAISYYDSYRTAKLPANLLQAQRDYFGAHTYKRVDKEGTFHTKWINKKWTKIKFLVHFYSTIVGYKTLTDGSSL